MTLGAFGVAAGLYGHRRVLIHKSAVSASDLLALRSAQSAQGVDLARALKQLAETEVRLAAVENRPRLPTR